jgi:hypothetical protein
MLLLACIHTATDWILFEWLYMAIQLHCWYCTPKQFGCPMQARPRTLLCVFLHEHGMLLPVGPK